MEVGVRKGELLKSYSVDFYTIIVQKTSEDKSPVGPYLLAFFIFVVCGSGKCLKRICVCVSVCYKLCTYEEMKVLQNPDVQCSP